jgi:hypothetical protein
MRTLFGDEVSPRDDEYVFNVMSFNVGPTTENFYILLKRLENGGNQFARSRPGRVAQIRRLEGEGYQPSPKLETIFISAKVKVQSTIVDPRIYGMSVRFPETFRYGKPKMRGFGSIWRIVL